MQRSRIEAATDATISEIAAATEARVHPSFPCCFGSVMHMLSGSAEVTEVWGSNSNSNEPWTG